MEESLAQNEILGRYEMGHYVAEALDSKKKKIYGAQAMELLAVSLGSRYSPDVLRSLKLVSKSFSRKQINELLNRRTVSGAMITYSQIDAVASLQPKIREQLLSRIFEEDLTMTGLQAAIREAVGGPRTSHEGRPLAPPKTIGAGLSQIGKFSYELEKRNHLWTSHVIERLQTLPPQECSDGILRQVETTINNLQAGYNASHSMLERLLQIQSRLKDLNDRKAAEEELSENVGEFSEVAEGVEADFAEEVHGGEDGEPAADYDEDYDDEDDEDEEFDEDDEEFDEDDDEEADEYGYTTPPAPKRTFPSRYIQETPPETNGSTKDRVAAAKKKVKKRR